MKEYVCGFMMFGRTVVLVEKAKPEWQKGRLNGVGGSIEDGETPVEAMVREFREETGVGTDRNDWSHRVTMSGNGWVVHFFRSRVVSPMRIRGTEDESVCWADSTSLPGNTIPNLRWLIPLCFDDDISGPVHVSDRSDPAKDGATVTQKL